MRVFSTLNHRSITVDSPVLFEHRKSRIANEIHALCRIAYRSEAGLIGARDFPPLRRTIGDIARAESSFIGCRCIRPAECADQLVGVVEVSFSGRTLSIDALAVHPLSSRNRIGTKLVRYALAQGDWDTAIVQTAARNLPAIQLYKKLGFKISRTWRTDDGYDLVKLCLTNRHVAAGKRNE